MTYYMVCLRENGQREFGTGAGHQVIFNDLKTLRGVLNRIYKYNINCNKPFNIYRYNEVDRYNEEKWQLVHMTIYNK